MLQSRILEIAEELLEYSVIMEKKGRESEDISFVRIQVEKLLKAVECSRGEKGL